MAKNFYKILTGVVVCAASTVAFANGDNFNSGKSYAKPGLSFGIEGGYGYMSTPEATYPNDYAYDEVYKYTSSTDTGDSVWGVHVAYDFKIKPNVLMGFEVGYKSLGTNNHSLAFEDISSDAESDTYYLQGSREYDQDAIDFLLTTHIYLYQGLNVFGKIGAAYVRSDITQSASSDEDIPGFDIPIEALNGDNEIWRIEPELSLGVGYMFNNHVDVHAAYTYIGGATDQPIVTASPDYSNAQNQPLAKVYSTNMFTVGISYTF
jgi:hypothetical protein